MAAATAGAPTPATEQQAPLQGPPQQQWDEQQQGEQQEVGSGAAGDRVVPVGTSPCVGESAEQMQDIQFAAQQHLQQQQQQQQPVDPTVQGLHARSALPIHPVHSDIPGLSSCLQHQGGFSAEFGDYGQLRKMRPAVMLGGSRGKAGGGVSGGEGGSEEGFLCDGSLEFPKPRPYDADSQPATPLLFSSKQPQQQKPALPPLCPPASHHGDATASGRATKGRSAALPHSHGGVPLHATPEGSAQAGMSSGAAAAVSHSGSDTGGTGMFGASGSNAGGRGQQPHHSSQNSLEFPADCSEGSSVPPTPSLLPPSYPCTPALALTAAARPQLWGSSSGDSQSDIAHSASDAQSLVPYSFCNWVGRAGSSEREDGGRGEVGEGDEWGSMEAVSPSKLMLPPFESVHQRGSVGSISAEFQRHKELKERRGHGRVGVGGTMGQVGMEEGMGQEGKATVGAKASEANGVVRKSRWGRETASGGCSGSSGALRSKHQGGDTGTCGPAVCARPAVTSAARTCSSSASELAAATAAAGMASPACASICSSSSSAPVGCSSDVSDVGQASYSSNCGSSVGNSGCLTDKITGIGSITSAGACCDGQSDRHAQEGTAPEVLLKESGAETVDDSADDLMPSTGSGGSSKEDEKKPKKTRMPSKVMRAIKRPVVCFLVLFSCRCQMCGLAIVAVKYVAHLSPLFYVCKSNDLTSFLRRLIRRR